MSQNHPDRRTFAIISHPDAGKTTLTEKLLVAGGAIHMAGEVKARGQARRARSDWMKIEQQRGISVTSSVMTFEHQGLVFNLLDTPGHEDFSEDTYRTLTAVDSAVMVIDAAKGIEPQTLKLFEVCRLRSVPIITFINKVDREGQSPFELLDEVADRLALDVCPMNWPVGMGGTFSGLYDLVEPSLAVPGKEASRAFEGERIALTGHDDPKLAAAVDSRALDQFNEEIELASAGYASFDVDAYRNGDLTPVYFGSALKEFGVVDLLAGLAAHAPGPQPQPAEPAPVRPDDDAVTGFVFKVQANMNPAHRDRIAFMRLCSGKFERGMRLTQGGTGKAIAISRPMLFLAQDREMAEEAWPGDIIGIPNHGTLRVGDTLSERSDVMITGLPNFAPEILRRVALVDPTKTKQLRKALDDMAEEGIIQVFYPEIGANMIVGVVGQLQLDVLISRLEAEYKVEAKLEASPWDTARWIASDDAAALKQFQADNRGAAATDRDGAPVFMAKDAWEVGYVTQRNPSIRFTATKERVFAPAQ
ncbi:peptide chain release factor 3 [Sphingopyxis terrae subsp. ummariensis]|jgi:peptide chain release factor 3|uniref:Peptide chain release factor 3 n=1 Tax=Sphingopyxis terrae subsp. terrae NBRC 15098 TaxID=1219058 RepID=A0A142W1D8_9SPHN|nr:MULTISPECIES: peptide chain release factor 3 [Sphingopyxis]AMU95831.1 peptide chain release factor 3 [Sphingopyxis terrae subsp. terrae NBRC 15098]MBD3747077.1 peptide chain release factor 3 [Sphingopyxis terrae]ODU20591.1 MAG: peptide chain release factor 3 [Sphingopyxis sp. SCN 67-31]QXF11995.1 peptide chain release factor 3 [Sphingopyxis terrae subsp. terrae]